MFIICAGLFITMTITSIFAYIKVCKEKQKKFLLFALPAHVISATLMFVSIFLIIKGKDMTKIGCILNLIAGIIAIYLTVISAVFKHIVYGKARKANNQN